MSDKYQPATEAENAMALAKAQVLARMPEVTIITIGEDGVPDDVNLYDVLEYIGDCLADCVRSGEVATVQIGHSDEVLRQAFHNTVKLLRERGDCP